MLFGVCYLMCVVWCVLFGVCYLVCAVWCVLFDVLFGVCYLVCVVWCVLFGVCYLICAVWCVLFERHWFFIDLHNVGDEYTHTHTHTHTQNSTVDLHLSGLIGKASHSYIQKNPDNWIFL